MTTEFIRFETEDKLLLQGLIYKPDKPSDKALLHIHGMAGNFYENRFLDAMAKELTDNGYAFLCINTRGHDFIADIPIAGTEEKYKRIGDAYEKFEECLFDIKPAVNYLEREGYTKIILCGHSLGAAKVVYYLTKTKDPRIKKLILMSPPDMIGLAEAESYHQDLLAQAKKLVVEGRGEEILPKKVWDYYLLSANTYVNFSSRDYPIDIFSIYDKDKVSLLGEINVPTLAFLGEKDGASIYPQQTELEIIKSKATKAPRFDTTIIKGGSHSYFSVEVRMAKTITTWLGNNL